MGVVDFWLVWDWRGRLGAFGGGPRGATKNGNCNTLLSAKGREGPRRTATATPFCPRRAAKGHEGPRRTATATPFCPRRAAKGHEGPRRTATATPFCPRRAAKGHEGMQWGAKNTSLIYWGVALDVGTGIAVRDVRGAEGDLTRPIFAAMMERGGYGVAPAGSPSDGGYGLPGEDEGSVRRDQTYTYPLVPRKGPSHVNMSYSECTTISL